MSCNDALVERTYRNQLASLKTTGYNLNDKERAGRSVEAGDALLEMIIEEDPQ